jgi:glycosyltransferase involved in cell wall biosynthesis
MTVPSNELKPRVSVIMPAFNQADFICRALESMREQTLTDWELIIIIDGPQDETYQVIEPYLADSGDSRILPPLLGSNKGLGAALNEGIASANAPLIAYLPADDSYFPEHLSSLADLLESDPGSVMAYSGVQHHGEQRTVRQIEGYPLQLVQVMHRRVPEQWVERDELTTDDLERMFWSSLRRRGNVMSSGHVSCIWFDHPLQRHKVIREDLGDDKDPYRNGGLNPYRARYNVRQPLRFHSSAGNYYDEVSLYQQFRERPDTPAITDRLKILLVGELAFNPERVLALEERGHKLYGLWMPNPGSMNTVGPLPFGHVEEIPRHGWHEAVKQLRPDIIYALLNWRAVPFAHQVLTNNPGVPFVWHLKEGPTHCREHGTWKQLVNLHTLSDGQIYSSPELRDWFQIEVPGTAQGLSMVLDGDLPKREWLNVPTSTRLSATDGKMHTVLAGRPMGLDPTVINDLANNDIHLHIYGEFQGSWAAWLEAARRAAPNHLHEHPIVLQDKWVSEFSKYDAGWLHLFKSENGGDIARANWDDLNYPARMATLLVAGAPLIQQDNKGAVFATHSLALKRDVGLFFSDAAQLANQLRDRARMAQLWENVWRQREEFTFDYHADELIDFFRQVIINRNGSRL